MQKQVSTNNSEGASFIEFQNIEKERNVTGKMWDSLIYRRIGKSMVHRQWMLETYDR